MARSIDTPQMGDVLREKRNVLARRVGNALTNFVAVEDCVLRIFASASGMPTVMAMKILAHVKTFSVMLDITDTAVCCRIEDAKQQVYWRSLKAYIKDLSGERNYLAHTGIVFHADGPPGSVPEEDVEPKMGPPISSMFTGEKKGSPKDAAEVLELYHDFQHATELAMKFLEIMESGSFSHPELSKSISRRRAAAAGKK